MGIKEKFNKILLGIVSSLLIIAKKHNIELNANAQISDNALILNTTRNVGIMVKLVSDVFTNAEEYSPMQKNVYYHLKFGQRQITGWV